MFQRNNRRDVGKAFQRRVGPFDEPGEDAADDQRKRGRAGREYDRIDRADGEVSAGHQVDVVIQGEAGGGKVRHRVGEAGAYQCPDRWQHQQPDDHDDCCTERNQGVVDESEISQRWSGTSRRAVDVATAGF